MLCDFTDMDIKLMRAERFIPATLLALYTTVLLYGYYFGSYLPVNFMWLNAYESGQVSQLSNINSLVQSISKMSWVDNYTIHWVYPGYSRIKLKAKRPVAKIKDNLFLSERGAEFNLPNQQNSRLPNFNVAPQRYQLAVSWLALSNQEGLSVQEIHSVPYGVSQITFEGGGTLTMPDLRQFHDASYLSKVSDLLKSGSACYITHSKYYVCGKG
ncbi:hypothetical protein MMH89_00800 [Candidatus Comchoanobacter bicostacola]|uniref:Uncharacterized protein n=1 Tax=Candidatus Comchoanobacter bicostacola TaxID=2919598 RepID=A0ABY5DLS7_9GAMM|nr:hypothetical protein [Candidatus Comchoanobacter bicostacola]UTC24702.1 hypothetical protein MMH89_00800 [Candidatus Comchoanobacter bicostacola]